MILVEHVKTEVFRVGDTVQVIDPDGRGLCKRAGQVWLVSGWVGWRVRILEFATGRTQAASGYGGNPYKVCVQFITPLGDPVPFEVFNFPLKNLQVLSPLDLLAEI